MILLSATNMTLQVLLGASATTNQAVLYASYADHTTTTFVPGERDSLSSGTTAVDIVQAPAASTQRQVKFLNIYNNDTVPMTVTVRLNNNSTFRNLLVCSLLPGDRIQYSDGEGFLVFNSGGEVRQQGVSVNLTDGLKNYLINGAYQVNQRGFAGGALAAGVYGYDMWKAGSGGCNITANLTTGVVTHTSGPVVQVMESPRLAGVQVTVSVEDLVGGSLSVNVDGQTGTITAGTGRRGATVTVPIGSTGNVTLTLTGTSLTYKNVQVERGPIATSFDFLSVGLTAAMCQRYAYTHTSNSGSAFCMGSQSGAAAAVAVFFLPVIMRANPAVSILSGQFRWSGSATSTSDPTFSSVSPLAIALIFVVSGGTLWQAGFANASGGSPGTLLFDASL